MAGSAGVVSAAGRGRRGNWAYRMTSYSRVTVAGLHVNPSRCRPLSAALIADQRTVQRAVWDAGTARTRYWGGGGGGGHGSDLVPIVDRRKRLLFCRPPPFP